jgi:ferrous iron transport protein B
MMTLTPASINQTPALIHYGTFLETEIAALQQVIEANEILRTTYNSRWLALTLLEGDSDLEDKISRIVGGDAVRAQVRGAAARIASQFDDDADILIADRRYRFIANLVQEAITRPVDADYTLSDRIDWVATHPWLGVPIFLALMWFVFQMTANVSGIYLDWIDGVINGPIARWAEALLGEVGLGNTWVESLVVDGIIAGAGGVLTFVPVLAFLYFFIALLEDSGYMARAAFVMDRFMQVLGLHGKSFIPLVVGFGCSVPGIYATRTLEDRRDRILTGLLVPFMSCAARLPVYVLIGTAFFGANSGNLVFVMYLVGIGVAVLSGILLRRVLFKREGRLPFVMEMPPFRPPSLKTVGSQVWTRTMGFVTSVWTVIVGASLLVWVLLNVPYHEGKPPVLQDSLFGKLSHGLAPVFEPAGFGTWEASGSLVTGMVAKEVIISTMSQVYEVGEPEIAAEESPSFVEDVRAIISGFGEATWSTVKATASLIPGVNLIADDGSQEDTTALQSALRGQWTSLQAVAFAVFVLLYTPCMATVGAIRQEFGSRWMWFSVFYMLGIAWIAAVLTYQVGVILGLG